MKHRTHIFIAAIILASAIVAEACEYELLAYREDDFLIQYESSTNDFQIDGNGELPVTVKVRAGNLKSASFNCESGDNGDLTDAGHSEFAPKDYYITDVSIYYSVDGGPIQLAGRFRFIPEQQTLDRAAIIYDYDTAYPSIISPYVDDGQYHPLIGQLTIDPPELRGKASGTITVYMLPRFGATVYGENYAMTNYSPNLLGGASVYSTYAHPVINSTQYPNMNGIHILPASDKTGVPNELNFFSIYTLQLFQDSNGFLYGHPEGITAGTYLYIPNNLIKTYNFNGKRRLGR